LRIAISRGVLFSEEGLFMGKFIGVRQ